MIKTIIITVIICQLISLVGLIMWQEKGFKDEWLILCCPLFVLPLVIIREIYTVLFRRPTIKVLKRHKTGKRYEMWTEYNRKTKIYRTEIVKENYRDADYSIPLYEGENKQEAVAKFNEYMNKTEKELEKIFKKKFKDI